MVQLREEARRTLGPDQLGTYIKVSRPSVWLLIGVIVALLAAGVAWFLAGTVNESVSGPCVVQDESCVVYAPLSRSGEVKPGDAVMLSRDGIDTQGVVSSVAEVPVAKSSIEASYGSADFPGFSQDDWGVAVTVDAPVASGTYSARIVTASHRPIRLLLGLD